MRAPGFNLALGQIRVEPGKKQENLQRARIAIQQAAQNGAHVILLPEALSLGWMNPTQEADEIPGGETFEALRQEARNFKIHVCTGLVERAGQAVFNSAVLIDSSGRILAHHRKINELRIAHGIYAPGDRLAVANTEFGKIGLMICADAFIRGQVIARALAAMGAQIILSPCAWAVPPRHDNVREPYGALWVEHYRPVAREFGIWIAGASSIGPIRHGSWAGWNCIGCSLAVASDGAIAAQAPYGSEALVQVHVTPRPPRRPSGEPGE